MTGFLRFLVTSLVSLTVFAADPVATRYRIEQSADGEYSVAYIYPGTDPDAKDEGSAVARQYKEFKTGVYQERGTEGKEAKYNPSQSFDGRTMLVVITRNRDKTKGYQGIADFAPDRIVIGLATFYQTRTQPDLPLETRLYRRDLPADEKMPASLDEKESEKALGKGVRVEVGMFAKKAGEPETFTARVIDLALGEWDNALKQIPEAAGDHVSHVYLQTNPTSRKELRGTGEPAGADATKLGGMAALYQRNMGFEELMRVPKDPDIKDGRACSVMYQNRATLAAIPKRIIGKMAPETQAAYESSSLANRAAVSVRTSAQALGVAECSVALGHFRRELAMLPGTFARLAD